MHRDGNADAGVGLAEFFNGKHGRNRIKLRAAAALGYSHAHDADVAELAEHFRREAMRLIPLGRVRSDLTGRECSDSISNRALLLRKVEVHRPSRSPKRLRRATRRLGRRRCKWPRRPIRRRGVEARE